MANSIQVKTDLIKKYQCIFDNIPNGFELIEFFIPGYEDECHEVFTLTDSDLNCLDQYRYMVQQIESAVGSKFFPVVRLSDGEFNLLLGDQWPGNWWSLLLRAKKILGVIKRKCSKSVAFSNASYSGGNTVSKKVGDAREGKLSSLFFIFWIEVFWRLTFL